MATTVIPIRELRVGAVLPAAIYDADNSTVMLLNRGLSLTAENLSRLQSRGIKAISIDSRYVGSIWNTDNGGSTGIKLQKHHLSEQRQQNEAQRLPLSDRIAKPEEIEYNPTLIKQMMANSRLHSQNVQSFYESVRTGPRTRIEPIQGISNQSIEMLLSDIDLFVKSAIQIEDESNSCLHSYRVANLTMSIATVLGHTEQDINQAGIGCMIARIGITPDLQRLMNVRRELTTLERLEVKKHPGLTWHALEKISDLSNTARQVAWQMNERWNGTGYPRGRIGNQIHPLARIAAVADVYIALVSARPYRPAMSPYQAIKLLLTDTQNMLFDPNAFRGLLKTTSLFPIGSIVELSNGSVAEVFRNNTESYDKPVVKTLLDSRCNPVSNRFVNLIEHPHLKISDALSPLEFDRRIQRNTVQNLSLDIEMEWADHLAGK
ncbi:HD domain-containing phosphohydrolase [Rubinisphaera sp.]|uniref:HD-GYP domain-containing protein n=1 Tax=Rubinisphaera sp. TaxID=2024857 RepID=UPI000C0E3C59|nr:HD domain-containing phosphohydrolase [Rubinisphaera sp.]MBV09869.1 hypothetical protein [Rubinisphaera sp.]|tara:strand:- start:15730 stop:17031 length:1302 start_codon:yes stop_codon:yes gene_type:complete